MTNLNKVLMFLAFLFVLLAFTVTGRGQTTQFELKGPIVAHVTYPRNGTWWNDYALGSNFMLQTADPSLKRHLNQMDGKKVQIIIKVVGD